MDENGLVNSVLKPYRGNNICIVYILVSDGNRHLEPLVPKDKSWYNGYSEYEKACKGLCEELVLYMDEIVPNRSDSKDEVSLVDVEPSIKIKDNVNRSVADNSRIKETIASRKAIQFIEPRYLVIYKNGRGTSLMIPKFWTPSMFDGFFSGRNNNVWPFVTNELVSGRVVKFSEVRGMFKGKTTDVVELREKLPNNILIDENFEYDTIRTKNDLTNEIMRNIKFCVDLSCSGKNPQDKMVFRIFNSLFELRDHCRDHHDKKIAKNRVLLNVNWKASLAVACRRTGGVQEYFLTDEEILKNDADVQDYKPYEKKEDKSCASEGDSKEIVKRKKKKIKKNFSQKIVSDKCMREKDI